MRFCRARALARSTLGYGYLSGKYTIANPLGEGQGGFGIGVSAVKRYDKRKLMKLKVLHEEMEEVRAASPATTTV